MCAVFCDKLEYLCVSVAEFCTHLIYRMIKLPCNCNGIERKENRVPHILMLHIFYRQGSLSTFKPTYLALDPTITTKYYFYY